MLSPKSYEMLCSFSGSCQSFICLAISRFLKDQPASLKYVLNFAFSEKTIKGNVERVIKIWEERKLFEKDYLEALRSKLGMVIC